MSTISWTEEAVIRSARWHSENSTTPPRRLIIADDRMRADTAYRLAREGTALLWRGDFHNARALLQAIGRRVDRATRRAVSDPGEAFGRHRRARRHRAMVLGKLVVQLEADHSLALRRAPDVRKECAQAYGDPHEPRIVSLTELLGVIGAYRWRVEGVEVPALGARIHPHYGVFSPVRGEYVELVAHAPLPTPAARTAFDLGTGTGVLAAVLAKRGFAHIVATDNSPRALACARDNVDRLNLAEQIDIVGPALFPAGRADLVVCNPPWIPAIPTSAVENGVYDRDSRMLREFLTGLPASLEPGGEGWLILSDLAEHLGLRSRAELLDLIDAAGLHVLDKIDTTPRHPKAVAGTDILHAARAREVTSLWRLRPSPGDATIATRPNGRTGP
ncbi:class I SAM-dependent methyltransferase [Nocardia sp. NPDC050710]|uniref:class I SAM-dependent methyltransferase n=1 Tax=Nocardia sp. NPDC050710 TaxID=3157220 RepID=UPI0033DA2932